MPIGGEEIGSIAKLAAGSLMTGGITSVADAMKELLVLINHLTEHNPVKEAKARRGIYLALMKPIKEIRDANQKDVSDLVAHFSDVMDAE